MLNVDSKALGVYRRLLSYVLPHWSVFMFALVGMVVYAATQPAFAALMKPLLDGSFVARDTRTIEIVPLLVVSLFVLRGGAGFLSTYFISWVGRRVIKQLRTEVFGHLLHLPASYYDASSAGMLVSKLTYNIEQVAESTTNAITVLIRDSLTVIGLVGWMFYLNFRLSLIILVVAPLIAVLVRYVSSRFRRYSSHIQDSMGDVTRVAEEVIGGHRVVKIFGGQDYETRQFEVVNERNRHLNMKLVAVNAGSSPIIQLIAGFGIAGIIYVATSGTLLHAISVGSFVSFLSAMLLVMAPLKHLTDVNAPLQKGIAAGESIFNLLDEAVESAAGGVTVERVRGHIRFDDVAFAYSKLKGDVLDGVNFEVSAGQTVAIVGRSGSGKTTVVSLLPRFYDVDSGRILVDGRDVRDYDLRTLREQIALVSQDVVLFNDTIERNIAYGSLTVRARKDVEAAASAAHAMEFISALPEGFDTIVGDRGVLLSGGQRQRIAIARALLKDAPILILDEATSALDTESERNIQAALEALMRNRTTLVIAHRLSTVEKADRILVLDQGRVVESGTHSELLEKGAHYANLYSMQFQEGG